MLMLVVAPHRRGPSQSYWRSRTARESRKLDVKQKWVLKYGSVLRAGYGEVDLCMQLLLLRVCPVPNSRTASPSHPEPKDTVHRHVYTGMIIMCSGQLRSTHASAPPCTTVQSKRRTALPCHR
jgi:hypothetical protein